MGYALFPLILVVQYLSLRDRQKLHWDRDTI